MAFAPLPVQPQTETPADVTTIIQGSPCFCLTGVRYEQAVLYLLEQIYEQTGGTPLTPAEIAANSKCFCLTGTRWEQAVLYLLDQINTNVGG